MLKRLRHVFFLAKFRHLLACVRQVIWAAMCQDSPRELASQSKNEVQAHLQTKPQVLSRPALVHILAFRFPTAELFAGGCCIDMRNQKALDAPQSGLA